VRKDDASTVEAIGAVLQTAAETHHVVYAIVDGDDDDWASWYADWLLELSELPGLLGRKPVRSELVYMLVKLAKDFAAEAPDMSWREYYARGLLGHFGG
jgi:hypothetical protein